MTKPPRKRVPPQKYAFLWRLMADDGLSASAKCVAATLLLKYHNTKTGRCNPSIGAVAKAIGRRRRAVFSAITELKAGGWIITKGTKGGSSHNTNQFDFNFEPVSYTAPVPVSPTSPVSQTAEGVSYTAHELSITTRALRREGGREISSQRAPDGALEEKFEQLCAIWQKRPYGFSKAKALKAFMAVCADHDADAVLASAANWFAVKSPRWIPKLEEWLGNGAWLNEPPPDVVVSRRRSGKANPVDEMLNAGGVRRNV